jgi:hypothetical protein
VRSMRLEQISPLCAENQKDQTSELLNYLRSDSIDLSAMWSRSG